MNHEAELMGFRHKLSIAFLIVALIPLGMVALVAYGPASDALVSMPLNALDSAASFQKARVQSGVQSYVDMTRLVASRTVLRSTVAAYDRTADPALRDRLNQFINDARDSVQDLREISLLTLQGATIASTNPSKIGLPETDDTVVRTGQRDYKLVDVVRSADGLLLVRLVGPLRVDDAVVGVISLVADADRLLAVTDDYTGLGQTGETQLSRPTAEDDGAVFLTPLRFDRESALRRRIDPSAPMLQALRGPERQITEGLVDYRGKAVLASVRYIDDLGWGLVVKMDEEEAYAGLLPLRNALLVSGAALLVLVPLLGFAVGRSISSPIIALAGVARRVRDGDLGAKSPVGGNDEMGFLARAFDEMTDTLATERRRVEQRNADLAAMGDFARTVSSTLDLQNVFDLALQQVARLTGCTLCRLSEFDTARNVFRIAAVWPSEDQGSLRVGDSVNPDESASGLVHQSGRSHVIQDIDQLAEPAQRARSRTGWTIRSRITVPIISSGAFWGTVGIGFSEAGSATPRRVAFLETMAAHLAVAIRNAELYSETGAAQEELRRSNDELAQFAYVASHDLQEPVRGIVGCLQLLQRRYSTQLDDGAQELIAHAVNGSVQMQALVSDLLTYGRVSRAEPVFERVDCAGVMARALDNVRSAVEEGGATVTYDPLPELIAHRSQLGQLFQNLIANAIKFRAEAAPEIHVGARRVDDQWLFSVRDNGIGIDPQHTERIFAMFQRLHSRGRYPGTGIGLALCKRIVERHGGRLWVESRPGEGSTFYFTIPDREEKTA